MSFGTTVSSMETKKMYVLHIKGIKLNQNHQSIHSAYIFPFKKNEQQIFYEIYNANKFKLVWQDTLSDIRILVHQKWL